MRCGNRSVRTSVYSLFWRTRVAQNVAPEGIRTRHLSHARQALYHYAIALPFLYPRRNSNLHPHTHPLINTYLPIFRRSDSHFGLKHRLYLWFSPGSLQGIGGHGGQCAQRYPSFMQDAQLAGDQTYYSYHIGISIFYHLLLSPPSIHLWYVTTHTLKYR